MRACDREAPAARIVPAVVGVGDLLQALVSPCDVTERALSKRVVLWQWAARLEGGGSRASTNKGDETDVQLMLYASLLQKVLLWQSV